jgi:plasmid stability protein
MGVDISLKDAPDHVVERLRLRAERNHRSVEGEVLAIVEAAVGADGYLTPHEILAEVRRLGLRTPSDSVEIIREMRDSRYGN